MEEGWVYVLVNSSIPGMAKVGRTTRAPFERAAELSGVTGVATPFIVAYEQFFVDCHAAEQVVHAELDRRGWRVAQNREFFRGAPSDIIRVVLEAGDVGGEQPTAGYTARSMATATALLEAGDQALYGLGDALQDLGEAVRCYRLASARGSAVACQRLGEIFLKLYAERRDKVGRRRVLSPLKEGARRGNAYCYCTMSELFALEGHQANFAKAWHLFFARIGERDAGQTEAFAAACSRYVGLCLDLRMEPRHHAVLRAASGAMIAGLLAELDKARGDDVRRHRVAGVLRWAYGTLLPEPVAAPRIAAIKRLRGSWMAAAGVVAA